MALRERLRDLKSSAETRFHSERGTAGFRFSRRHDAEIVPRHLRCYHRQVCFSSLRQFSLQRISVPER